MKRLLIVNPNTNADVTRWLAEEARRVAPQGYAVESVNADSGLAAIETPGHIAVAAAAVARAISAAKPDAAVIGAFGDPGLAEARAGAWCVAGLGESGLRAAGRRRFAIVTLGAAMQDAIARRVEHLRLAPNFVALRILPGAIADYVAARDARLGEVADAAAACVTEGAETVLLGGAPFAGQARRLAELGVRVIDGVEAAVAAATA